MTQTRSRRAFQVGVIIVLAGLTGLAAFVALVWQAVTVEDAARAAAERRLEAVRATLPTKIPLVAMDDRGRVVRRAVNAEPSERPVARLRALVWRAAERRLVSVDSPFWFVKLKGPAAAFVLQDTGLDLERLGLTPADLERAGPAIVFDHESRDGSLLLMWTE